MEQMLSALTVVLKRARRELERLATNAEGKDEMPASSIAVRPWILAGQVEWRQCVIRVTVRDGH